MKTNLHPRYDFVVFKDAASDAAFLTRSTKTSDLRTTWSDGNEYPLINVEVTSASHPFFTGKEKLLDTAGRIEKFQRKYSQTRAK